MVSPTKDLLRKKSKYDQVSDQTFILKSLLRISRGTPNAKSTPAGRKKPDSSTAWEAQEKSYAKKKNGQMQNSSTPDASAFSKTWLKRHWHQKWTKSVTKSWMFWIWMSLNAFLKRRCTTMLSSIAKRLSLTKRSTRRPTTDFHLLIKLWTIWIEPKRTWSLPSSKSPATKTWGQPSKRFHRRKMPRKKSGTAKCRDSTTLTSWPRLSNRTKRQLSWGRKSNVNSCRKTEELLVHLLNNS